MASACPCLACGLTTAKGDRRTLEGSSADRIVPIWKEFVTTVAQEQGITISEQQLSNVLTPNTENGTGFMHRKCFYSFGRYLDHKVALLENIKNALGPIIPAAPPSQPDEPDNLQCHVGQKRSKDSEMLGNRRMRVIEGQMHSAVKRLNFTPNTQGSPAVAVSASVTNF